MALRLNSERTFTTRCSLATGDDFAAVFRILPDDQIEAIFYGDGDRNIPEREKAFLTCAVVRIEDLVDDDGKPVAWTPAFLPDLIGQADIRVALMNGYRDGLAPGKAGN
jgi:hypothetical protein